VLLLLVVKALVDLTKRALPKTLNDLISVPDVIPNVAYVFRTLRVEAMVVHALGGGAHELGVAGIDIVNLVIVEDLGFLVVEQVLCEVKQDSTRLHRECGLASMLIDWGLVREGKGMSCM
jgi:hypothetical protein